MLFGSQDCILEFDGSTWTTIPVGDAAFVRGLQVDEAGTIWVGGGHQTGKLVWYNGNHSFEPMPNLPSGFGPVWQAFATDKIYFFTDQGLYSPVRDRLEFTSWPVHSDNVWRVSVVDDRLFAHALTLPLFELTGDHFSEIVTPNQLSGTRVQAALKSKTGQILLVTRDRGIFELKENSVQPFKTAADAALSKWRVLTASALSNGDFAVLLDRYGVILLGSEGSLHGIFSTSNGLPSSPSTIFKDRSDGLWLGGDNDLIRLQPTSNVSVFDAASGLGHSTILQILRQEENLFAAAQDGLYRLITAPDATSAPRFERVAGIDSAIHAIAQFGSDLLIATNDGVQDLKDSSVHRVLTSYSPVYHLTRSAREPNRVFLAFHDGIGSIRFHNGEWMDEGRLKNFDQDVHWIAEADDGDLYLATLNAGFFRVKLNPVAGQPFEKVAAESLATVANAPKPRGRTRVVRWGNQVLFKTDHGAFLYNQKENRFQDLGQVAKSLGKQKLETLGATAVAGNRLWLQTEPEDPSKSNDTPKELFGLGENGEVWKLPFAASDFIGQVEQFYEEKTETGTLLWLAGLMVSRESKTPTNSLPLLQSISMLERL
jgi:hypothetical protein